MRKLSEPNQSPFWGRSLGIASVLFALLLFFNGSMARAQRDNGQTANGDASALIGALSEGGVYVAKGLQSDYTVNGRTDRVDVSALQNAVERAKPTVVKIVAVAKLGNYPTRDALADDLRKRLALSDDAVVIVGTPKGISASAGRLSKDQFSEMFQTARLDTAFAQGGLTGALVRASEVVSGTVVSDRRSDTGRSGGLVFGGLALVGGFVAFASLRKRKAMDAAKAPLLPLKQQALDSLVYVDGYLDILPQSAEADRAKSLRASAYEAYSTANGIFQTAKTPEQIAQAGPLLQQAVAQLGECRSAIDKATSGTGVVLNLPSDMPSLQTDAQKAQAYLKANDLRPVEAVQTEQERDRMQDEINQIPQNERGVSFFSGRPLPASDLVPVTVVVQGQKRTVMASREEADTIMRGQTPQVRAFPAQNGQYVPWYEHRNYDPYRDYYGGWGYNSGVGTLVDLYLLSSLMGGGMFGGYGPWGWGGYGWGMAQPPVFVDNTYYSPDYAPANSGFGFTDNAGGQDFFGGNGGSFDPSPDHSGGVDFFGGGYDEGGGGGSFDFGGDSGGGDFGDGDSGGGGFDF